MAKVKVTICDKCRRMIRECKDPEARMWAAEVMVDARKIVGRLIEYKNMKCPKCNHRMEIETTDGIFDEYDDNIFKKIGRKLIGKKDPKGD